MQTLATQGGCDLAEITDSYLYMNEDFKCPTILHTCLGQIAFPLNPWQSTPWHGSFKVQDDKLILTYHYKSDRGKVEKVSVVLFQAGNGLSYS